MALGAVNRHATKRSNGVRYHVIPIKMPSNLAVGFRFGNLRVPDEVPWARRDKPQGLNAIARAGPENIAGDLLFNKSSIWLVFVQCTNRIVAIGPCVRTRLVLVISMRVSVMNYIEPVPRPSLSILWHGEKIFDKSIQSRLCIDTKVLLKTI